MVSFFIREDWQIYLYFAILKLMNFGLDQPFLFHQHSIIFIFRTVIKIYPFDSIGSTQWFPFSIWV